MRLPAELILGPRLQAKVPSVQARAKKKEAATKTWDPEPASAAAASRVLPLGQPGTRHQDGRSASHRPAPGLLPPQGSLSPSAGDRPHSTISPLQHPCARLLVEQDSGTLDLSPGADCTPQNTVREGTGPVRADSCKEASLGMQSDRHSFTLA